MSEGNEISDMAIDDVMDAVDDLFKGDDLDNPGVGTTEPIEAQETALDEPLEHLDGMEGDLDAIDETEESQETEEPDEVNIDYELEVPMPDGQEPIKLGALKDKVVRLERLETDMIDRENELMVKQDEFAKVMNMMGGEIPDGVKAEMSKRQQVHLEREHDAMMRTIPSWKDKTEFEAGRKQVVEVASMYGFSADEMGKIADHRVIKILLDHSKLLGDRKKAQETVTKLRKKPTPKGVKPVHKSTATKLDKQVSDAMASNDRSMKHSAIDALINQ